MYIVFATAEIDKSLFVVKAVLWVVYVYVRLCVCVVGVQLLVCVCVCVDCKMAMKCACVDSYKNSNNGLGACSSDCIMNAQGQG